MCATLIADSLRIALGTTRLVIRADEDGQGGQWLQSAAWTVVLDGPCNNAWLDGRSGGRAGPMDDEQAGIAT